MKSLIPFREGGGFFTRWPEGGGHSWGRDACEQPWPMSRSQKMGMYLVFAAHFSLFSRNLLPRRPKSPLYSVLAAFGAGTLTGDPALLYPHLKLKKDRHPFRG